MPKPNVLSPESKNRGLSQQALRPSPRQAGRTWTRVCRLMNSSCPLSSATRTPGDADCRDTGWLMSLGSGFRGPLCGILRLSERVPVVILCRSPRPPKPEPLTVPAMKPKLPDPEPETLNTNRINARSRTARELKEALRLSLCSAKGCHAFPRSQI